MTVGLAMTWDHGNPEDESALHAELLSERLTRIALDMNVALGHTDGFARVRLERAIDGINEEIRLLAARRLGVGEVGADRRPG